MSVHVDGDGSAAPGISPRETSRQLEGEIAVLRDELSGLVAELDGDGTSSPIQAAGAPPRRRGDADRCGLLAALPALSG
jgi:hypothetical protein